MLNRILGALAAAVLFLTTSAVAQGQTGKTEPVSHGRTLSEWVADLKAPAPQSRNAAAYEISSMGPAAAPAVPALVQALDDSSAAVRFPVTVALGEIGPAASAAVPRLKKMMEEETNDELASAAKRAIRKIQPAALAGQ